MNKKKRSRYSPPSVLVSSTPYLRHYRTSISLVCSRPKRWTRVRVRRRVRIDVKHDTRHISLIQTRPSNTTRRSNGAASTDFQVQALRVQLCAIVVLTAVKSDNFVADDVVAWSEFRWQDSGDFEVVLDEGVGDPGSWGDDSGLADLGPFEGGGGEGRAIPLHQLVYLTCTV
jgi:hypothetical protein